MGNRWRWVAWSMLAVFIVSVVFATILGVADGSLQQDPAGFVVYVLGFGAFMVVGALVVAHRPGNPIGWIFSSIALLAFTGGLAAEYVTYALVTRPGSLPGATFAAWYASWTWYPTLALAVVFTPLLFPTGRLLSPRWRSLAWLAGAATAAFTVLAALKADLVVGDDDLSKHHVITNPIGIAGIENPEESTVGVALLGLMTLSALVAFVSLVLRFRRSRGEERQQLKWFTYAGALVPLTWLADVLPAPVGDMVSAAPIVFLPAAAGIAILRYRLYDIDRLINRTLVYGLLTALLAGIYAGLVLVLGPAVRRSGQGSAELGRWPARPWRWRRCSSRPAAASRQSWIAASIAASTTRPRRSRPSASACGTRSTWTRSRPSCWPWSTRRCSRRRHRCGFGNRRRRHDLVA